MANLLSGAPRPGQPRAPRRSRARCGAWTTCRRSRARPRSRCSRRSAAGEIKAVWIACTNPAQSLPDQTRCARRSQRAEFVVVQEAFARHRDRAYADLLLPAATWGEKDGTVTNSRAAHLARARRGRRRRARRAPTGGSPSTSRGGSGAAAAGRRRRCSPTTTPKQSGTSTARARAAATSTSPACRYAVLERDGPQQWPFPEGARSGRTRLYDDGVFPTPTGARASSPPSTMPPAEEPDARFPLRLNTGRLRDQWHGMSRTGLVARLFSHSPEPEIVVAVNPICKKSAFRTRTWCASASRRGSVVMKVRASDDMRPGDAFVAMHWGGRFTGGVGTNALTVSAIDPYSRQPELKHAAVRIEPFAARWRGAFAAAATPELQRAAAAWLAHFDYAALTLVDGPEILLRLELAAADEPAPEALSALEKLFGQPPVTGARRLRAIRLRLLQGRRTADPRRRCRRRDPRRAAEEPEVRHQLRLLRARTAPARGSLADFNPGRTDPSRRRGAASRRTRRRRCASRRARIRARSARTPRSRIGFRAPAALAAICTSQARCSVHSVMKASGTDGPQASRPWLRRITACLPPDARDAGAPSRPPRP